MEVRCPLIIRDAEPVPLAEALGCFQEEFFRGIFKVGIGVNERSEALDPKILTSRSRSMVAWKKTFSASETRDVRRLATSVLPGEPGILQRRPVRLCGRREAAVHVCAACETEENACHRTPHGRIRFCDLHAHLLSGCAAGGYAV